MIAISLTLLLDHILWQHTNERIHSEYRQKNQEVGNFDSTRVKIFFSVVSLINMYYPYLGNWIAYKPINIPI